MKRFTILVVDDIPTNLSLASSILKDNYNIIVANRGQKAIEIVEKKKPDLILLDIMMPDISGYTVIKRIKEIPGSSDIPVIFFSAKNEEEDFAKAFELGCVDYVTKPVKAKELLARVQTHLTIVAQKQELLETQNQLQKINLSLEEIVAERTNDLQEALKKMEWQNKGLRNATFVITHTIRAPLSTIIGLHELINYEKIEDYDSQFAINSIHQNAHVIDGIIHSLVEVVSLAEKPVQLNETLNGNDIKNRLKSMFSSQLEQYSSKLNFMGDLEVVFYSSEKHFFTIMHNLIQNAIIHSGDDANVVDVSFNKVNDTLVIDVRDYGVGISREDLKNVFQLKRLSELSSGIGLGLYVAQHFAFALGGELQAESEPELGTTFRLTLPI